MLRMSRYKARQCLPQIKTQTATGDDADYQHADEDGHNVVPRLYAKFRISRDTIDGNATRCAVPNTIAQLSTTIRTIHTSLATKEDPNEATVSRPIQSKLRNNAPNFKLR